MHPFKLQILQCQHISFSSSLSVSSLSIPLLTTFRTEDDRSGFIFSQAHFVNFSSCTRIFSHLASLRPSLGTLSKFMSGTSATFIVESEDVMKENTLSQFVFRRTSLRFLLLVRFSFCFRFFETKWASCGIHPLMFLSNLF